MSWCLARFLLICLTSNDMSICIVSDIQELKIQVYPDFSYIVSSIYQFFQHNLYISCVAFVDRLRSLFFSFPTEGRVSKEAEDKQWEQSHRRSDCRKLNYNDTLKTLTQTIQFGAVSVQYTFPNHCLFLQWLNLSPLVFITSKTKCLWCNISSVKNLLEFGSGLISNIW